MRVTRGRIVLVRHGETEANRDRRFALDDVCLTELGRSQALNLANRLQNEFRPQHLVCSEFLRARQTGEIIAEVLGLAMESMPGIHELDFGCLKGQPYEALDSLREWGGSQASDSSGQFNPWVWRPPGGESPEDVRSRVLEAIETLRRRYPDGEVVVVCHGIVIQAVWAHLTGEWREGAIPPNCGIVSISHSPEGWEPPIREGWEYQGPRPSERLP